MKVEPAQYRQFRGSDSCFAISFIMFFLFIFLHQFYYFVDILGILREQKKFQTENNPKNIKFKGFTPGLWFEFQII